METYSLGRLIKSDLARLTDKKGLLAFLKWYFFPRGSTFPHDVWFRVLQRCKRSGFLKYTLGLFAYIMERHLSFKYDIHANSNIPVGPGLQIVHGSGVYLNCASVGSNVTVYQSVTFGTGRKNTETGLDIPTVENDVTVYPGAVIAGGITLHSGCVVAANSFVNCDVPPNSLVAGAPGRIVRQL